MRIEHIAIWADDIELLRDFYLKYFNLTLDIKLLLWMEMLSMLEVHLQVEQLIVNNHPFFKKEN